MIRSVCRRCKKRGPSEPSIFEARQAVRSLGWKHTRRGWMCPDCRYTVVDRRFQWALAIPLGIVVIGQIVVVSLIVADAFGSWAAIPAALLLALLPGAGALWAIRFSRNL